MKEKGEIDLLENILFDNDIDAFRHAYVSGVFTLELDANFLKKALENDELIISLYDSRKFGGETSFQFDSNKPVIVLKESETGRNELFCDLLKGTVFDCESFASAIKNGEYPEYLIASIDGLVTPMSKPDDIESNNLG